MIEISTVLTGLFVGVVLGIAITASVRMTGGK